MEAGNSIQCASHFHLISFALGICPPGTVDRESIPRSLQKDDRDNLLTNRASAGLLLKKMTLHDAAASSFISSWNHDPHNQPIKTGNGTTISMATMKKRAKNSTNTCMVRKHEDLRFSHNNR
jgi:hypothetical protein